MTTTGYVYTCGRVYSSTNVAGNATFHAGISGTWSYANTPLLMDDNGIGFQGRVIEVDATGSNSYLLMDNSTLIAIGSNGEGQATNGTSTSGNQITPLILEGM